MNTDLNTEELDIQISKDVFDLENVALAFWEDVLASSPNLMKGGSGSIRTIVLSETATLVANARPIGSAITTPPQGILITHGLVSLDVGFRLHYLASVHHHKKLPKEVKSRWVEVCLDIVEKLEREYGRRHPDLRGGHAAHSPRTQVRRHGARTAAHLHGF